jgi:hypothetical protein
MRKGNHNRNRPTIQQLPIYLISQKSVHKAFYQFSTEKKEPNNKILKNQLPQCCLQFCLGLPPKLSCKKEMVSTGGLRP